MRSIDVNIIVFYYNRITIIIIHINIDAVLYAYISQQINHCLVEVGEIRF